MDEIGHILKDPNFDKSKALEGHLSGLLLRKNHIEILINNVPKTINSMK